MFMPQLSADGTRWIPFAWDANANARNVNLYDSGNQANANAVATIPALAGQVAFITAIEIYAGGATAAALVDVTIAGLLGGAKVLPFGVPAGATLSAAPLVVEFDRPIPASAVNTAITATLPALGAGNTKARVVLRGGYY